MEITVPKNGITGLFDKLSERIFQEDNRSTRHGPFLARFNKRILGQLRNIVYEGLLSKEKYIDFKKPLGEQEREFTVKERFCILSYELRAKGLTNKADKLNKILAKLDFPCARSAFTGDLNVVHEVEAVLKLLLILSNNEALMTPDVCEVWRKVHSSFQFLNAAQNDLPSFHSNNEKDSHHDHVNLDYQIYPREIFEVEPSFGIPKKGFGKEDISLQVDLFSQGPGTLCGLFEWFGTHSNKDVFMKKTRTSLYDALIHSQTNDLEVKLSLPDLPLHPSFNARPLESTKILKKNDFETFNGCQLDRTDIVSDDSGVYDLNIWDEALKAKPSCFHTWEGRKQIISQNCKPFLTEAGAEVVNYLYDIRINEACFLINSQPPSYKYLQVTELIRDGLMVLIGVPSQTFQLEKSTSSFVVSSTVRLSGCSPDSLQYSLNNLAELGTNYLRLDKFTNCQKQSTLIKSSVLRAFIMGLRKYLQKYRQIVILVTDSHVQSVLDLCTKFRKQAYELRFLSDICMCPQGFAGEFGKPKPKFPVGVKLLSYLYQLCLINASSPIANLLLFLLKVSCSPYLRFVKQWMFKGRCIDVYKEFMISENDVYLTSRDKYYWTNGYVMSSTTKMEGVPVFLKDLAEDMFTCGKSINLLKLCFPDHYICNHQVNVPVMSVTYSLDSLKVVCDSSRRYYEEMKELEEQKNLDWRRKKVEEKSRRERVLIDERHKASKALAEVQELVKKAKQALKEKKKEELDFLKQQMEDALNKKILDVKEADEEDARVAKNSLLYEVTTAKLEEKLKQETRDELIHYYEELTREAERREKRAIWLIGRRALNNERQTFFEEEDEKLREMRKEINDELEKDKRLKSVKMNEASSVPRKQWTINNQTSNTIIPDEVDGVPPVQHPSQSTVQDLIYNISDARHSQSRLSDETSSQSLEKVTEDPVRHPTESTVQNLMYPTADQDMIRHRSSFLSQEKTNNDRHGNISRPEDTFTTSYQRTSEPLSTIQHIMYGGNDKSSGTTRGHEPSSTIQHLMYTDSDDKSSGTTRGHEPSSTIQHLMYTDSDNKSSGTTRGHEPSSTIQHIMYTDSDNKSSGTTRDHEPSSTIQHLMYTDSDDKSSGTTRDHEPSSTIQHLMYTDSDNKSSGTTRGHEPSSTIQHIMYTDSDNKSSGTTRDHEPSSTIQHLMYTDSDNKSSGTTRGHEPSSTIQHLMYTDSDNKSSGTTRGHEPSSTIQHIMYTDSDNKSSGTTRDHEPSSTIQHLMYPDSDNKSSGTANLTRGNEPGSTIQYLIDSDDKSSGIATLTRGSEPVSTIQLYPNSGDKSSGIANLTRGHEAVSTIQDLMYPVSDNMVSTISSTRGSAPASTIESLLYPDNVDVESRITSSRGSEPASTIENLLYPSSSIGRVLESEKFKREPLTHEDVWLATQFEPLPDNFDILDEEPCGDIFARVFQKGLGGNGDVDGSEPEIGNIEIENDACKVFCLPVILQRCVMEPLITQINVVNSAIVRYFLDDLKLIEHFETLKKFLLMEDGEFSLSLTQQLFERVSCGVTPQQLCCISTLNSIMAHAIQSSVYACQSENTRSLSFVLKSLPDIFKRNDVGVFDFIELRYKIRWPANIVITENCITKYNRIFAFMFRLKRTAWVLQDIRTSLKRMDKHSYNSPQLRKVHLFRHEMSHFVNDVQGYISNQILHVTWQEFLQSLEHNVRNLDDLHDCHAEYLNKALFRALLNKKAAPVMKIISDLFTMVLKFHTQLVSSSWHTDQVSGQFVHPAFSLLCSTHDSFKESTCFLFTVISKLVTRGYQPHLEELLLRLNFNCYYGKNISGNTLAIYSSEI